MRCCKGLIWRPVSLAALTCWQGAWVADSEFIPVALDWRLVDQLSKKQAEIIVRVPSWPVITPGSPQPAPRRVCLLFENRSLGSDRQGVRW
jgi:hypothetical protein